MDSRNHLSTLQIMFWNINLKMFFKHLMALCMTESKFNFQPKKLTKELQHLGNFFGTVATVFEGILCFCGGATEETLWFYLVFFAS